jgi:hypothetical protein
MLGSSCDMLSCVIGVCYRCERWDEGPRLVKQVGEGAPGPNKHHEGAHPSTSSQVAHKAGQMGHVVLHALRNREVLVYVIRLLQS